MAALEAAHSIFSPSYLSAFPKPPKSSPCTILHLSISSPTLFLRAPPCPLPLLPINQTRKSSSFEVWSAVEEIAVEVKPEQEEETQQQSEQEEEETQQPRLRKKLFVLNLPWTFKVLDIKNLFGECGTVSSVEIIKHKNGKSRGYAFVTMASGEEAQAVVDKFDSHELLGRIIKVEFAKKLRRPAPPPPASHLVGETRYDLYVSNLAWKVRSSHLREFFVAAGFNQVAPRVVFEGKRSAGYGFASFTTKEEADSAIAALDGKELMDRPLRLRFSTKTIEDSKDGKEEEATSEEPQEEATSEEPQE
ncbi:RNA-binding protein CP33, chloroplastic isoform X1 [Rhododendron vialii]|uniref:RNA-binding protein CP33, chloroplastic isoform X1 n=1 Tax=Rhododendron vialii TaxID=182163 RepID=UPI00265F570D|nr:RNA-binding protein CP33, chloroplastic isoform X1 [Rhododendron vialii]XP_058191222.1 RNA-binding protein CP33, chloroplastic isoform X1 [Rhododendron vialii]